MPTDGSHPEHGPEKGAAVFLFAHQDDEFAIFSEIENCIRTGYRAVCVYLTTGAFKNEKRRIAQRNRESIAALRRLGVPPRDVFFLGEANVIPDGQLHTRLDIAFCAVSALMKSMGIFVQRLYISAWEGGHQDHDAVHLVGQAIARQHGLLGSTRQFSLYHGKGLPWIFFRVLSPIEENGPVQRHNVSMVDRLRHLTMYFHYRSQLKTWIGLFPFVVVNHIFVGQQELQPVESTCYHQRPHAGRLLYERRRFCSFAEFSKYSQKFIDSQISEESTLGRNSTRE